MVLEKVQREPWRWSRGGQGPGWFGSIGLGGGQSPGEFESIGLEEVRVLDGLGPWV